MCGPTARVQSNASVRLMSMMNLSSSSESPLLSVPGKATSGLRMESPKRVHENVDAAECAEHLVDGALSAFGGRHVGDDGDDAPAGRLGDVRGDALDILRGESVERDVGASLGQHLGNALADAAPGPRDENDFSGDIELGRHHGLFLPDFFDVVGYITPWPRAMVLRMLGAVT